MAVQNNSSSHLWGLPSGAKRRKARPGAAIVSWEIIPLPETRQTSVMPKRDRSRSSTG